MKSTYKLFIMISFTILSSSCTYVYYPTYPVVPDTKDKGVGIQGTIGFTRAQLSGWYAFDSNLYITASAAGALSTLGNRDSANSRSYNAVSGMLGAGYKLQVSDNFEFQVQGGVGACRGYFHSNVFNVTGNNTGVVDLVDIETQSFRGYLQPVFGFMFKRDNGLFLIPRVTYESFNSVKQVKSPFFNSDVQLKPRSFFLTEFYAMGRINARVLNIDIYLGVSANLFNENTNSNPNDLTGENAFVAQPFLFGVGVSKTFY